MNYHNIKSGYVYVMINPAIPNWVKVGRTYRPPHKRAVELSRTSLPLDFEVKFAKFFWNAHKAEKHIHNILHNQLNKNHCRKEFFKWPLESIAQMVNNYEDSQEDLDNYLSDKNNIMHNEYESMEDLELRWELAYDKVHDKAKNKNTMNKGWREMARLSAEGWGRGSANFAEEIMCHAKNKEDFAKARWVWSAAEKQGVPYAHIRGSWCYSLIDTQEAIATWLNHLDKAYDVLTNIINGDSQLISFYITQTLDDELSLWKGNLQRKNKLSNHKIWKVYQVHKNQLNKNYHDNKKERLI